MFHHLLCWGKRWRTSVGSYLMFKMCLTILAFPSLVNLWHGMEVAVETRVEQNGSVISMFDAPTHIGVKYWHPSLTWVGERGQMTGALDSWLRRGRTNWEKDGKCALKSSQLCPTQRKIESLSVLGMEMKIMKPKLFWPFFVHSLSVWRADTVWKMIPDIVSIKGMMTFQKVY